MKFENMKRGQIVSLNIEAARPIRLGNGVLHEAGQRYKVLGGHGTFVRLSRVGDNEKLIVEPERLTLVTEVQPSLAEQGTPVHPHRDGYLALDRSDVMALLAALDAQRSSNPIIVVSVRKKGPKSVSARDNAPMMDVVEVK